MYRVLIVEDDPMVAMINEQYVTRNKDFTVVGKCGNGRKALEFLESESADLIIMDVYMPSMDGLATLKEIRERDIPASVIMVTAANDTSSIEQAIRWGAVDYLVKPFTYDRFKQALDKFLMELSVLKEGKTLNQDSIDYVLAHGAQGTEDAPKGIQEKTKALILECLSERGDFMTGEEIAEAVGLSGVTVRKYASYLVESGDIEGKTNYETGGRPSMLFRIR